MRRPGPRFSQVSLFDRTGLAEDTIKNLNLMILAVIGGVIWGNITGGVALTGFLKDELGASDFLYGILTALPPIANSFQFLVSYQLERNLSRTKTFLVAGFIQRVVWLPIGLIPFIIPMQYASLRLWMVVLLVTVSAGTAPFMNSSLYSMFADIVPVRIRSRYFGTRSRIGMLGGLFVGLAVAALLDVMPGYQGYAVVFSIAALLGTADIACFLFMKLPEMKRDPSPDRIWPMMRRVFKDKNYMKLVAFGALWYFAVYLASPFINVYMLNGMQMTKLNIVLLGQVTSNAFTILIITRWGRAYDEFGTKPVLIINTLIGAFVPLMWTLVRPGMLWLVFIINAISGMQWAPFELGAQNMFMGQAPEKNRSMYMAVYFIGTQLIGITLASSLGGWMLDNPLAALELSGLTLGGWLPTRYHMIFLLSTITRFLAILILPGIKESGAATVGTFVKSLKPRAGRRLIRPEGDNKLNGGRKNG